MLSFEGSLEELRDNLKSLSEKLFEMELEANDKIKFYVGSTSCECGEKTKNAQPENTKCQCEQCGQPTVQPIAQQAPIHQAPTQQAQGHQTLTQQTPTQQTLTQQTPTHQAQAQQPPTQQTLTQNAAMTPKTEVKKNIASTLKNSDALFEALDRLMGIVTNTTGFHESEGYRLFALTNYMLLHGALIAMFS